MSAGKPLLLIAAAVPALTGCGTGPGYAEPGPAQASRTESVVLLHGLARTTHAVWLLANRLEGAGYHVERVGYRTLRTSPQAALEEVTTRIDACCGALDGPVHFVGHSLGGLMVRAYLRERPDTPVGKVVLLATPNNGTPFVDTYRDTWWFEAAGELALALGTDPDSFANTLPPPEYPVGIIEGIRGDKDIESGGSDGLVPVDSTRLEGMTDFIVIDTGHSTMRYDGEAARQTIEFLKHGHFAH
ncbi:MAG: alpha/beta fold hydrolase [Pseudomonadota bacterium]|nr:alpha/beta fold hydrolase [Pseudomonadota bacterium]